MVYGKKKIYREGTQRQEEIGFFMTGTSVYSAAVFAAGNKPKSLFCGLCLFDIVSYVVIWPVEK